MAQAFLRILGLINQPWRRPPCPTQAAHSNRRNCGGGHHQRIHGQRRVYRGCLSNQCLCACSISCPRAAILRHAGERIVGLQRSSEMARAADTPKLRYTVVSRHKKSTPPPIRPCMQTGRNDAEMRMISGEASTVLAALGAYRPWICYCLCAELGLFCREPAARLFVSCSQCTL